MCVANYPAQQNCSKLKQDCWYQGESDDSSNKMKILYVETKKDGKKTHNTINEATQEEHEKLEEDNNNGEATELNKWHDI